MFVLQSVQLLVFYSSVLLILRKEETDREREREKERERDRERERETDDTI